MINPLARFLGDTANHPEVRSSKLSEIERDELELELNIAEFDKAVEVSKNNTAPGINSISNRFIKTFWPYFRKPLFEYSKHCYNRGTLTDNFRSAKIRKRGTLPNFPIGAQLVYLIASIK
jgi:hypothetical protein